jgi:hypothetical protein
MEFPLYAAVYRAVIGALFSTAADLVLAGKNECVATIRVGRRPAHRIWFYIAGSQFRYNNRKNAVIFGLAIAGL